MVTVQWLTIMCHSHQLQLRLHKKKKTKQTENNARMHSIDGNNNLDAKIHKSRNIWKRNSLEKNGPKTRMVLQICWVVHSVQESRLLLTWAQQHL